MKKKDLIEALNKLPDDAEINVMRVDQDSIEGVLYDTWTQDFKVVHLFRNIYRLDPLY